MLTADWQRMRESSTSVGESIQSQTDHEMHHFATSDDGNSPGGMGSLAFYIIQVV